MKKMGMLAFALLVLLSVSLSADAGERIREGICNVYGMLKDLLPVIILAVIVLAGVVFAAGQVLGAETRSRANVWATNMIIYSVIAIIVVLVVPYLLSQIDPNLDLEHVCE